MKDTTPFVFEVLDYPAKAGRMQTVVVDREDAERVSQRRWIMHKGGMVFSWLTPREREEQGRTALGLHRFVMGIDDPQISVAPINGNYRDCRKQNLMIGVPGARGPGRLATSGYRGVYQLYAGSGGTKRPSKRWEARVAGVHKGTYRSPEEAAHVYDAVVVGHFGEEGRKMLNFPEKFDEYAKEGRKLYEQRRY